MGLKDIHSKVPSSDLRTSREGVESWSRLDYAPPGAPSWSPAGSFSYFNIWTKTQFGVGYDGTQV